MAYNTKTVAITVNVRESYPIASFGQETVYAAFAKMSPAMLATLIEEGAMRILRDGAGGKDKTDDEKIAGMRKRIDAWLAGDFTCKTREPAMSALMSEAYVADQLARFPNSDEKGIRAEMQKTVRAAMGEKTGATWDNFARALAVKLAKADAQKRTVDELIDALNAKYEPAAEAIREARAKAKVAVASIDLTAIDI